MPAPGPKETERPEAPGPEPPDAPNPTPRPAAGPTPPAPPERDRLSRWLLPTGEEPDPRFTLANERTFLAWLRTGLALIAGAIAIEGFLATNIDEDVRRVLVVVVLALGMTVSVAAGVRWLRVERAMRHKAPLHFPVFVPILILGTLVAAVVVLYLVLANM